MVSMSDHLDVLRPFHAAAGVPCAGPATGAADRSTYLMPFPLPVPPDRPELLQATEPGPLLGEVQAGRVRLDERGFAEFSDRMPIDQWATQKAYELEAPLHGRAGDADLTVTEAEHEPWTPGETSLMWATRQGSVSAEATVRFCPQG